nr:MAG: hypothetical protein DIU80_11340 [Chloroflexota bacterium]
MSNTADELHKSSLLREVAFFALYIVLIGLGLFVGLIIWRQALGIIFYEWLSIMPWVARFLYMFFVVAGAIAMVIGLLAAEPYLNNGKRQGQLMRRFLKAAVPIIALGVIGGLIMILGG